MKEYYLIRLAAALPAPGGEGEAPLPGAIQLSPAGWVETETQGKYLMDDQAADLVIGHHQRLRRDVVIDYEHQTLHGGEAPAAGWVSAIEKRADGLWAAARWTARATAYLTSREYRYLSPVLMIRKADRRPVALHSVAMTNSPEIHGMLPLVASQRFNTLLFEEDKEDRMKEFLIHTLKLPAEATDEQIQAAIKALAERPTAPALPQEMIAALSLAEGATLSEAIATVHALKQPGNVVSMEEFRQLKQRMAERDRDDLVVQALADGKITPAQKEWADEYALRDPEGFKVFMLKAPVVLPLGGKLTTLGGRPANPDDLDETQLSINKMMGVETETFKKYQPAR